MAFDLHPEARALIESRPPAHLVTTRPNGRPHVALIWLDVTDAGQIQFGTPRWRVKAKNLRHDPRCTLSIQDTVKGENGLIRHLLIEASSQPSTTTPSTATGSWTRSTSSTRAPTGSRWTRRIRTA
ncbi:pyridoxamine 5'-phosphate oxidase family protein [Streptomyces albus]